MAQIQQIRKAIDLALAHILERGLDDIIKPPIFGSSLEHSLISNNFLGFKDYHYRDFEKFINSSNLQNQKIGNPSYFLIPKDHHTFRRVSWMDPRDLVCMLSVALLIFPKIEAARIPKSEKIVHSHRMSDEPDSVFDANFGYESFREESGRISQNFLGGWKVISDISNFFDRISNHDLVNKMEEIGCDEKYTKLIENTLFQWSPGRRSIGIPVGTDFSRIISEVALIEIDKRLAKSNIKFVRYVDDYRFFAKNRSEAYDMVRFFSELLSDEGAIITLANPERGGATMWKSFQRNVARWAICPHNRVQPS